MLKHTNTVLHEEKETDKNYNLLLYLDDRVLIVKNTLANMHQCAQYFVNISIKDMQGI